MKRTDIPDRSEYYDKFYPHMFIEDVKLRIMPIGGRVSKKEFNISLDPPDLKMQQIIEKALSPDSYHHDFAGIICDFIASCAVHLLIYETVTYEIVYLSEPKNGKTVGFELVRVNPYTLVRRGNALLQFLPNQHDRQLSKRCCVELKPERILTFELPVNIQGKMDQIMESMRILSLTSPDFFMKELAAGFRKTPYDVTAHYHLKNVALARITKDFGWNARNSFEKEASEYYLIYRYLKFEKSKIELRNCILDTLNSGLELVGKQLNFNTKILVNGLPTLEDVRDSFDHLIKGDVAFREILEPFQGF
ncbi:MAG: hypothetical protein JXA46_07015 [Dehalococcoidales bacterium]|nr:hypothetical protein [Dehalococcoidales bacterium]